MFFKKKKLTILEYFKTLVYLMQEISKKIIQGFENEFGMEEENENLGKEVRIFSLWIMTISLPKEFDSVRDFLHDEIVKASASKHGITEEEASIEIDKRYQNYFYAFNKWQKDPQAGHIIGTAMVETIKNNNPNFSFDEGIPTVSDLDAMAAFTMFASAYELNIEQIGQLNKNFEIVKSR